MNGGRPYPDAPSHRDGVFATLSATVSTMTVVLPTFLLGGLAVFVRDELSMSLTEIGVAVSAYFGVSALASLPAGLLIQRVGSRVTTAIALLVVMIAFAAIALAPSGLLLIVAMAIGGIGNALGQLSSNQTLTVLVPRSWQGRAFGIKQASVPASGLLAGIAVGTLGSSWRIAFLIAIGMAIVALVLLPARNVHRIVDATIAHGRIRFVPLAFLAVSAMFATGAANALSIFLVGWSVDEGLSVDQAALVLAVSSASGILGRLLIGWFADRTRVNPISIIALQVGCGAVGLALVALGLPLSIAVGGVIGYALGWSWAGLIHFAVARLNPHAPARATSVVQVGLYSGGAIFPALFGVLADTAGTRTAWVTAAALMAMASIMVWAAGRNLTRSHQSEF